MIQPNNITDYFPFNEFRPYQEKILTSIKNDFENGIDVIILNAPVGFGKSPVNIALGKYFNPTFYTTPQVKLIEQLSNNFCPKQLAIDGGYGDCISFLGRYKYICRQTGVPSDICEYRNGVKTTVSDYKGNTIEKRISCSSMNNCTYNEQKKAALDSKITIITFAMLLINSYTHFFPRRNLLIIDECHNLENQIVNLFAGFTISQKILPNTIVNKDAFWIKNIEHLLPKNNSKNINEYLSFFNMFNDSLKENLIDVCFKNNREEDKIHNLSNKISNMLSEIEDDKKWVVDIRQLKDGKISYHFSPILINTFLQERLWNQADKIILTSATIPYRMNIKKWLKKLGLNNKKYKMYSVPMTFPVENRKIVTKYMSGKMTRKEEEKNWNNAIKNVKCIINNHTGEKGVIHTQSYNRAKRVYDDLKDQSVFLHDNTKKINKGIIHLWDTSNKQVLISPSIKDGVDLKGDLCRFQILLKVPYPDLHSERVSYLLNHEPTWYYEETIRDIVQMYGRAIRSPEDYATFYIIDSSFADIIRRYYRNFPKWFLEVLPRYKK